MSISQTNLNLINKIKKVFSQTVTNKLALKSLDNKITKSQSSNKQLKELYELVKNVSTEHNTLTKLTKQKKQAETTNALNSFQQKTLSGFTSFQSQNQVQAIHASMKALPKQAQIKQINAVYKNKHIIATFVNKATKREQLQKLVDKISEMFHKKGVKGSIGVAVKYEQGWRGSKFVSFGEKVRLHTNQDSDEAFDDNNFLAYSIYYSEKPINAGGAGLMNDCLYECLSKVLGDSFIWKQPIDLKKKLKLSKCDLVPISCISLIEKELKNIAINVTGDYIYNSPIQSNKRINIELINGHYSLTKEMNTPLKFYSFRQRKPIIYNSKTHYAYDGNKVYVMSLDELKEHYDWKTDYIIINHEEIIYVNKIRTKQTLEEQYTKHIEETKVLKEMTDGKINLCKTGSNKFTALHLFDSLTKHITPPPLIKQSEAEYIENASQGALIFNTKDYKGSYHKYDIKSAYPSIMKSVQLFPVKEGEFKQVTTEEFNNYQFYPFGIFRCKITYDDNYKKLFRFSDKNYYTHIDLTRAKELNLNVELIIDEQANFLYYSRDKLMAGTELFGRYIDYCFDLKQKKAPRSKQILNILWGALCEKKIKKVHNNNNETYIIPDNAILHEIRPINDDMTTFKVSKMNAQYKTGFARMMPFILAKARTKISKIIEPYKNICVRCHTDSMNLIELPTDIKLGDQLGDLVYEGFFTP